MLIKRSDISVEDDLIELTVDAQDIFEGSGKSVLVQAEIDESVDLNSQVDEFESIANQILQNSATIKRELLSAIFNYYQTYVFPKKARYEEVFDISLQQYTDESGIAVDIQLNVVMIVLGENRNQGVGFSFSCHWDPEHGMGVRLRDNKVIKVGGADVSFLPV